MKNPYYHNISSDLVLKITDTNSGHGLTEKEALLRREAFGGNSIEKEKDESKIKLFFEQFKSPLIYILIFAGILTFFLGKWTDSVVILIAVIVNSAFGFLEENKVSNVLKKLKKTLKTKAIVLRDGVQKEIFQENLVPGDIIFLQTGKKVPADARLIEADNLMISESVLTGEWLSETKITQELPIETSLADRKNMVYMGSLVENGQGRAVVVATGKETEAGKIATLLKETKDPKTPLQQKLSYFSKIIGILIGTLCLLILIVGFFRGGDLLELFEASIAVAVGGIPESLPIVMTIILAIGTERILKKKGLIRKLSSVETLGSTQIICFDKTKTLTQGKMVFDSLVSKNNDMALTIGILCNEAFIENPSESVKKWSIKGPSTSVALLEAGIKNNLDVLKIYSDYKEIKRIPFDSEHKYLLSLREKDKDKYLFICGAPEKLLKKSKKSTTKWQKEIEKLGEKGLRVIGVGYKKIKRIPKNLENIDDFDFVGLIALKDPLRKDAKKSIDICKKAGMEPILITGDHKVTAKAVANKIGIEVEKENIMEGSEIDILSDQELLQRIGGIKVYARVEPKHKLRIIGAWQEKGKVVAMAGDGVNDAPAIKKADIGISLGSGTDVAKEASDLILIDDSFNAIISTIEEGRRILDNLRKSIAYVLADCFTSVILVGFSKVLLGWPLPILPVQILWNNFVEDSMPTISFAFEPKEKDIMKRKPSPKKTPLLTKEMKILIFATGLIDEFLMLLLFWYLWQIKGLDLDFVRTIIFGGICIDTAFVVYSYKNLRKNIWQINPFSNEWLNVSSIIIFLTFALAIYFPPIQTILHTVPLGVGSWAMLTGIGVVSLALIEATKYYFISRHLTEN